MIFCSAVVTTDEMGDNVTQSGGHGRTLDDYVLLDAENVSAGPETGTKLYPATVSGPEDVGAVRDAVVNGQLVLIDLVAHVPESSEGVAALIDEIDAVDGELVRIREDEFLAYDPTVVDGVSTMTGGSVNRDPERPGDVPTVDSDEVDDIETDVFDPGASSGTPAETVVFETSEDEDASADTAVFDNTADTDGTAPTESIAFCPACGDELEVYDSEPRFCPACGKDLSAY